MAPSKSSSRQCSGGHPYTDSKIPAPEHCRPSLSTFSQRINKHVRLFLDMLNLGNEPYRTYIGTDPNRPSQEERYKIWAIIGVKLDF